MKVTKEIDRPKGARGFRYSDKQKYEAVALYKLLGSLAEVSKQLQINYTTLQDWKASDWWKDFEYDLTLQDRTRTTKRLEGIRDRAITVVMDRLENGDFVYDSRSGEIHRKPINAHVANRILNDSIDKAVLIEKLNHDTKQVTTQEKIADRLLIIQQKFKEMALKQQVSEVIELKENENGIFEKEFQDPNGSLRSEGENTSQDSGSNEVSPPEGQVTEEHSERID